MNINKITEEDLNKVVLPLRTKVKIFFVAIPLLFLSIIVMFWEVFKELLSAPSQVIDLLYLEESLKELTKDK